MKLTPRSFQTTRGASVPLTASADALKHPVLASSSALPPDRVLRAMNALPTVAEQRLALWRGGKRPCMGHDLYRAFVQAQPGGGLREVQQTVREGHVPEW